MCGCEDTRAEHRRRDLDGTNGVAETTVHYGRPMAFHDLTMTSITGDQVSFDDYKGKLALVVNVASA